MMHDIRLCVGKKQEKRGALTLSVNTLCRLNIVNRSETLEGMGNALQLLG